MAGHAILLAFVLLLPPVATLDNGLGRLPPLGWSSWNYFANDINESVIMEMADAMVSTGLASAGFKYINIDAGYLLHERDSASKLTVNPALFPSGIRKLADHVHSRGLKLGVYTDITDRSCGKGPGSYGHYKLDADTIAHEWDADYLKVDYCGRSVSREPSPQYVAFANLRDALNQTGKPIYYSICPHTPAPKAGTGQPYNRASVYSPPPVWTTEMRHALANSLLVEYTNTFDLWYADPTPAGDGGAMNIPGGWITNLDSMLQMTEFGYSAPGSFNDADMLQVCTYGEGATRHWNSTGKPDNRHGLGMTLKEYTAHLSVWAILGSPLIHSADLRTVGQRHADCLALMTNPEIIAVNQDPLVLPARLLFATTNVTGKTYKEVNSTAIVTQGFGRLLTGKRAAAVLFNRGEEAVKMELDFATLGLETPEGSYLLRDVVGKRDLGEASGSWSTEVASHAVVFVLLSPVSLLSVPTVV